MARSELIQQLSISPTASLLAAIEQITKAEHKILLVVDNQSRLTGVLTDYDIRRAIIDRSTLDTRLSEIVNAHPVVAGIDASDHDIVDLMRRMACAQIPIISPDGRPVDVRFQSEFLHPAEHAEERVAVVMAGGLGTRLRPMTDHTPKPMLHVGGRPILFILLDQIISEGFTRIYLTLFYKSKFIIDRVRETPHYRDRVEFVIEEDPLGTAGSLSRLAHRPLNPFLVINADLLTDVPLQEMLQFHRREGNEATIALKQESFSVPYGVAEVENGRITALREKPEIKMDVNTGVYILSPSALDHIDTQTRLDMPQLVSRLLAVRKRVGSFPIHEFWLDVGTPEQYNRAQIKFSDRDRPRNH